MMDFAWQLPVGEAIELADDEGRQQWRLAVGIANSYRADSGNSLANIVGQPNMYALTDERTTA